MPFVVVALLVVAVHLATALGAMHGVGLLADDHFMVGLARLRHDGVIALADAFVPAPVGAAAVALYRPFIDLSFWLEQPVFGLDAFGYHVTNSLLHCGSALLWFGLVRRWSGSALVGAAAALWFVGWPGHSEATHWIAARTNVMSTFWLGVAVVGHDAALRRSGGVRWLGLCLAAVAAVVAVGSKESAVFVVPVAAAVTWWASGAEPRPPLGARLRDASTAMVPMVAAIAAWLAWRAHCLGTWGSGTGYGWRPHRIDAATCADWARVLLAPAHEAYVPGWFAGGIGVLHVALLLLAMAALRLPAARRAAAPAAVLLGLGYLAGIGLERLDVGTLENVRYTYEPALGFVVLAALGLLALPPRARPLVIAAVVVLHGVLLHQNRQSWLRVSAVYRQLHGEVLATARTTGAPLRVFDAPGVHDGAFGFMNAPTEFLFWQRTAPPGTDLRGLVSSSLEWSTATQELAAAAERRQLAMPAFTVRWTDGALVPFALDPQWPQQPWPGTTIGYARIGRERPFVGTRLPVHAVVRNEAPLTLRVAAGTGRQRVVGRQVAVAPGAARPVWLEVQLPPDAAAGSAVPIELQLEQGGQVRVFALGDAVPALR